MQVPSTAKPLHTSHSAASTPTIYPKPIAASSSDPRLAEDLESFVKDAVRSVESKVSLRDGFYTGDQEIPHHHIDEKDYADHRVGQFPHSHHLMSLDHDRHKHHKHHHHH